MSLISAHKRKVLLAIFFASLIAAFQTACKYIPPLKEACEYIRTRPDPHTSSTETLLEPSETPATVPEA